MANNEPKYKHPNQEAIEKYLKEIAFWEQKEQEAIEKENYSYRDWARSQLHIKRTNLNILVEKVGKEKLRKWKIKL